MDILDEARETIEDREGKYGPSPDHWGRTVAMLNVLLAHKLRLPLTVEDWPKIMVVEKLARDIHGPLHDNPLDIIGYAAGLARVRETE